MASNQSTHTTRLDQDDFKSTPPEAAPRPSNTSHVLNVSHFEAKLTPLLLLHSELRSMTPVATKVHVILRSFVVLIWIHDIIELV